MKHFHNAADIAKALANTPQAELVAHLMEPDNDEDFGYCFQNQDKLYCLYKKHGADMSFTMCISAEKDFQKQLGFWDECTRQKNLDKQIVEKTIMAKLHSIGSWFFKQLPDKPMFDGGKPNTEG